MLNGGRDNRSRAALSVQVERMAALIHAPAIVFPAPDKLGLFPEVLSVDPGPDLTGFFIDRHAPRIPQTVGPDFGTRIFSSNERVINGNRISLGSIAVINVNTEHA